MASLMMVNPRSRRRKATTKRRSVRRAPARRVTRRRRNPIGSRKNDLMSQIQNAAVGAGGALAVDIAMSKLPIPANLKAGPALPAVKGAIAVGLGMLVSTVGKKRALGKQLAEGGLTVALHDVAKPMLSNMGLAGYDDDDLQGYNFDDFDDGDLEGVQDFVDIDTDFDED